MSDLEKVKAWLAEIGVKDGESMVPGVEGRMPDAVEFIDYYAPLVAEYIHQAQLALLDKVEEAIGENEDPDKRGNLVQDFQRMYVTGGNDIKDYLRQALTQIRKSIGGDNG